MNEVRQDLSAVGIEPIGFCLDCPRCRGKKTFYSAGDEDWVCCRCGLIFSREESNLFSMIDWTESEPTELEDLRCQVLLEDIM